MIDSIIDNTKLGSRYYQLSVTFIDNNIREEVPSMSIINFSIEKDFRQNFFPVVRLQMTLSQYLYKFLLEYKNTLKVRVNLISYVRNPNDDINILEAGRLVHIDDIFQPLIGDISDTIDDDSKDPTIDSSLDPCIYTDLYLFPVKLLDVNKEIINFIAKDCKVKDAIGYIFKKIKVENVLMSKPDNESINKQLIVPPMNFKNSVQFISNNYGIYDKGMRQFYDFDTYYLISNNYSNIPLERGDYTNVYMNIFKKSSLNSTSEGFYKDDNLKCYIVNCLNTISITSQGSANKELNGSIINTYTRKELENAVKYDEKNGKFKFGKGYYTTELDVDGYNGKDKVAFTIDQSQNSNKLDSFKTQVKFSNIEFTMSLNVFDLNIFKLNKIFIFRFEESKFATQYNGRYFLNSFSFIMETGNGEVQALCKFVKVD